MEKRKNEGVQNTHITLKECLNDPNWIRMYNIIIRDTRNRLRNHFYDD